MRINADFSKVVLVDRSKAEWISSPASGVDRIMLDRIGDEVARATSIVRYAKGSSFSRHEHAKGEEFLVLEGIFSDDQGDYPPGTYVRNPPGSSHSPYSDGGCRILVKLRQFDPQDLERIVIDTRDKGLWQRGDGADSLPLHSFGNERVRMIRIGAGQDFSFEADPQGIEIFIVSGSMRYRDKDLPAESWLRFPPGQGTDLRANADSVLWEKTGHLVATSETGN